MNLTCLVRPGDDGSCLGPTCTFAVPFRCCASMMAAGEVFEDTITAVVSSTISAVKTGTAAPPLDCRCWLFLSDFWPGSTVAGSQEAVVPIVPGPSTQLTRLHQLASKSLSISIKSGPSKPPKFTACFRHISVDVRLDDF